MPRELCRTFPVTLRMSLLQGHIPKTCAVFRTCTTCIRQQCRPHLQAPWVKTAKCTQYSTLVYVVYGSMYYSDTYYCTIQSNPLSMLVSRLAIWSQSEANFHIRAGQREDGRLPLHAVFRMPRTGTAFSSIRHARVQGGERHRRIKMSCFGGGQRRGLFSVLSVHDC